LIYALINNDNGIPRSQCHVHQPQGRVKMLSKEDTKRRTFHEELELVHMTW